MTTLYELTATQFTDINAQLPTGLEFGYQDGAQYIVSQDDIDYIAANVSNLDAIIDGLYSTGDTATFVGTLPVLTSIPIDVTEVENVTSNIAADFVYVGGSTVNTANQLFTVDLSSFSFRINDVLVITHVYVRGDFSSRTEFIDVGFGTAGAMKNEVKMSSREDTDLWKPAYGVINEAVTVVDIGGGTPGINIYVSPSNGVNYSPGAMTNHWELALSFRKQ